MLWQASTRKQTDLVGSTGYVFGGITYSNSYNTLMQYALFGVANSCALRRAAYITYVSTIVRERANDRERERLNESGGEVSSQRRVKRQKEDGKKE